jgi:hypothetical protein
MLALLERGAEVNAKALGGRDTLYPSLLLQSRFVVARNQHNTFFKVLCTIIIDVSLQPGREFTI